jgi:hypothetical protein
MAGMSVQQSQAQFGHEQMRLLTILCNVFIGSLCLYVGVAWWLVKQAGWQGVWRGDGAFLTGLIGGMTLAPLLAAPYVSRMIMAQAATTALSDGVQPLWQAYLRATIVAFAMREIPGTVGLVLTCLTGEVLWCFAFSGMAICAMVLGWPNQAHIEQWRHQGHLSASQ